MAKRNNYIVHCSEPFMAPDSLFYTAVWGRVTKIDAGIKVGFNNDYIILNPDYIISRALCNVKPLNLNNLELNTPDDEDEEFEFKTNELYVCVQDKAKDGDVVSKLNKSKVKKRDK